jgi:predicted esterase
MQLRANKSETTKTARVFTAGNLENPTKIWIVCHGYGQLADYFIQKLEALDNGRNLLVAPEGLHRFYTKGFSGRVGASWMTKEEREDDISDYISWLSKVYQDYAVPHSGAKIILLGFSQGGATVSRWLEKSGKTIDYLILYASTFPVDVVPSGNFGTYIKKKIFFVLGTKDEFINAEEKEKQIKALRESGKPVELLSFDGGHEIDPLVLKELERKTGDD